MSRRGKNTEEQHDDWRLNEEGVYVTWNHGVKHFGCKECGVVVPYRYAKKNPIQFCCLGCAKLLVDKAYSRFY